MTDTNDDISTTFNNRVQAFIMETRDFHNIYKTPSGGSKLAKMLNGMGIVTRYEQALNDATLESLIERAKERTAITYTSLGREFLYIAANTDADGKGQVHIEDLKTLPNRNGPNVLNTVRKTIERMLNNG